MLTKTSLLTSIPENFYFNSGFNFISDSAEHINFFPAVCYLW